MTKQLEDYPKLDKWLDNITQADDERWCFREDVETKVLEMESTITQLQEQLKQAEVNAIEKMIKELCPTGMGAQPDDPPYELTIVWDVFGGINEYLSKLKGEQE